MVFHITREAKKYYEKLDKSTTGKLKTEFDFYYLCLLAGFSRGKVSQNNGVEFYDKFPNEFYHQRQQVIGLLISTEIERRGVNVNDNVQVEKIILYIVKPDSVTLLSNEGEKLLDQYAQNGFELISDEIPVERISNLDTFLAQFYELIK